jgi:hypothetical protein
MRGLYPRCHKILRDRALATSIYDTAIQHGGFVVRLIRLVVVALVGYLAYEFLQGLVGERPRKEQPRGDTAQPQSPRRGIGAMTGPGRGQRVQTEDASGTAVPHFVGRGVV